MQRILNHINYEQYRWDVIVDYKLIKILCGLMQAASKYPCIFCLWDSKYKVSDNYTKTVYPMRPPHCEELKGKHNVIKPPLIPPSKIILPPLHIKIGITTLLFKKTYNANPKARTVLDEMFSELGEKKLRAIYDGPKIKRIFESEDLSLVLTEEKNVAFSSLKNVRENFLGNQRATNYIYDPGKTSDPVLIEAWNQYNCKNAYVYVPS